MTRAPNTIKEVAKFWEDHGGRNLGIVGDTKHQQKGTSYHLGKSQLAVGAYSVRLKRDRKGKFPTEAASALDLGKLEKSIPKLRKFSNRLVEQAKDGQTPHIREIIWSPDGKEVRRWDQSLGKVIVSLRRRKNKTIVIVNRGNGDATHFRHTHISFYRDSQHEPKVQYFERFFLEPHPGPEPEPEPEDDVDDDLDVEEEVDPPTPGAVFVKVERSPASRSTLSGIAHLSGTTVKKLLAFPENAEFRDDPGLVFAGQKVRVR